jgi:hypothetical protein
MDSLLVSTQKLCSQLSIVSSDALIQKLKDIFVTNKYIWSDKNYIGLRMSDIFTDEFSDYGIITINEAPFAFSLSTKPGSYFLEHPENKNGCACLKEGQHKDMWQFHNVVGGWTGDPYCSQINPITVLRQIGKHVGDTIDRTKEETGLFGINMHTWKNFKNSHVLNLSAGCQTASEDVFMEEIYELIKQLPEKITYTLLNKSMF